MVRPRKQPTEETTSPEAAAPEGAAAAAPEPATAPSNGQKLPSKTEMVFQAKKQGRKRKPDAIQDWIVEAYGVPKDYISLSHIATILSTLKKSGKKPRLLAASGAEASQARHDGEEEEQTLSVDD